MEIALAPFGFRFGIAVVFDGGGGGGDVVTWRARAPSPLPRWLARPPSRELAAKQRGERDQLALPLAFAATAQFHSGGITLALALGHPQKSGNQNRLGINSELII